MPIEVLRPWGRNDDHPNRSPTDPGLRPWRGVGAQSRRAAAAVVAVRLRALGEPACGARAFFRVFRSEYLASRVLFADVCGAFAPLRYRLTHGGEQLREDADHPANRSVCRELDRACVGLRSGRLRARGVVILAQHYSRIEG